MPDKILFTLDDQAVSAYPDESIWEVAKRHGSRIPHLCHLDKPGYRPDGNCRACMVEIDGERVLAASCIRKPSEGMVVKSKSDRADKSRRMVFELLAADMKKPDLTPDSQSDFWNWANNWGITGSDRLPSKFDNAQVDQNHDVSNPAIAVNLDACIACGACVRACREVQVNDVLGMGGRGSNSVPVFDFGDTMGSSTCVTCGECVQACPTGALFEKSLMNEDNKTRKIKDFDKKIDSVCPFCGVGCQTTILVKDDKIVQVDGREGPANDNRLCVKGRFGYDYIHHADRLTKPLIRRDDAPKASDIDLNQINPMEIFREASWEEAMARAVEGYKTILKNSGGSALCGFGSAKGSNEEAYLFQKLIRQGFGTNNVDHCTRLCHASSVAALLEGIGSGAVSAPFKAAEQADCIVIIGCRPATNHPVAATYIKQAAKRGAKLIVLDPRLQNLMRHASHPIQFTAGTDVALLNAMLHVIIEENLYDEQYIQAHVSGFAALQEKVKDFSPEAMSEICGVEADTIREIARIYARSERSIIFWGMGISQHTHGTDNARCLIALALITGQVGRDGTGLHPLRGQNNVQGASDAGLIPMFYPDYKSVENDDIKAQYENAWGQTLDPGKGLTVVEIVDAIHDDRITGMYVMGENPAMSDPDQLHARAALAKLEHLVVQDIFLTETAWHADVVFPASAHAEKLGTFTNTNRQIQLGREAVSLPGEARQDWHLICELANGLGLNWNYQHISDVYAEMQTLMPSLNNIDWQRLEREDCVTYPADSPDKPGNAIIFRESFPTEDGRGKIVPADLLAPDEVPDQEYPMVLTTGRLLEHWHTGAMTRRSQVLDDIEPEGIAAMNGREIEKQGLKSGQMIEVSTRRGTIEAVLREDREVADGMVFMPFCFVESPANRLTNAALDPFGKIPEFKFCAAKVNDLAITALPTE
jgi:formate dehydrogenase major subunit